MDTLPLELLAYIAEFLTDDLGSLKACTLACSILRFASRPLILRTIRVNNSEQLDRLCDLFQEEPTVGLWVQHICVGGREFAKAWGTTEQLLPPSDVVPRLQILEFRDVNPLEVKTSRPRFLESLSGYPGIRTLIVSGCEMGYPYFQGLLCSFPHLEHVRLEDVALLWDPSDDVTATSWPAQPKLRTLELTKVFGTRNICRWLKSTSSVHSLRRIVLSAPVNGVVNYWGASGLEDLMVVCPLHEIRIEFVPFDLPNQWRSIDIQVNEDAAIRKTMTVFHGHNTGGFYWFSWPTYFFKPHMFPLITLVIVRD